MVVANVRRGTNAGWDTGCRCDLCREAQTTWREPALHELDTTVREMAEQIAAAPAASVRMARSIIRHLALPEIRSSMDEEMIGQTYLSRSDDMAELRAARAEERPPHYTGS